MSHILPQLIFGMWYSNFGSTQSKLDTRIWKVVVQRISRRRNQATGRGRQGRRKGQNKFVLRLLTALGNGGSILSSGKVGDWSFYIPVALSYCLGAVWKVFLRFWAEITYTNKIDYGNIGENPGDKCWKMGDAWGGKLTVQDDTELVWKYPLQLQLKLYVSW